MHDDRDDQVRALFHRIDDGPPLGIDVTDVMARGRRVRTRRTGLAAVGSVLAIAAAVVVVSVNLAGQTNDTVRPAETPRTTTSTSSPNLMPPAPGPEAPAPAQGPQTAPDTSVGQSPEPPGNGTGSAPSRGGNAPPPADVQPDTPTPPGQAPGSSG
jgi:hypothetical protein